MNIEEVKKYIKERKREYQEHEDDARATREHLRRKYLRLHHMEGKVKDYKKLKEITRMKKQLINLIAKNQKIY